MPGPLAFSLCYISIWKDLLASGPPRPVLLSLISSLLVGLECLLPAEKHTSFTMPVWKRLPSLLPTFLRNQYVTIIEGIEYMKSGCVLRVEKERGLVKSKLSTTQIPIEHAIRNTWECWFPHNILRPHSSGTIFCVFILLCFLRLFSWRKWNTYISTVLLSQHQLPIKEERKGK